MRGGAGTTVTEADTVPADVDAAVEPGAFRRALTVSLLNPKSILFFVSFFSQFVDPSYAYPVVSFLVLGTIAEVFSFVYLTTLIFAGSYLARSSAGGASSPVA